LQLTGNGRPIVRDRRQESSGIGSANEKRGNLPIYLTSPRPRGS
jgi:hypothetical protein